MRPFSNITREDIEMEVKAIVEISKTGGHLNIVGILGHGPLSNSTFYFIDMELCDFNLDDYISGRCSMILDHADIDFQQQPHELSSLSKQQAIWTVMTHITEGLSFLHGRNFVHRDLKPRNGMY